MKNTESIRSGKTSQKMSSVPSSVQNKIFIQKSAKEESVGFVEMKSMQSDSQKMEEEMEDQYNMDDLQTTYKPKKGKKNMIGNNKSITQTQKVSHNPKQVFKVSQTSK